MSLFRTQFACGLFCFRPRGKNRYQTQFLFTKGCVKAAYSEVEDSGYDLHRFLKLLPQINMSYFLT